MTRLPLSHVRNVIVIVVGLSFDVSLLTAAEAETTRDTVPAYKKELIQGKVVWLAEAMKRRHGINWTQTTKENVLALETADGQLLPIVEDVRGRSFRTDSRLRKMRVELSVRRYQNPDMIQVVRIYELKDGKKLIVDYWCDICSIVMFEDGPCDCCQDDNRLRKRPDN